MVGQWNAQVGRHPEQLTLAFGEWLAVEGQHVHAIYLPELARIMARIIEQQRELGCIGARAATARCARPVRDERRRGSEAAARAGASVAG